MINFIVGFLFRGDFMILFITGFIVGSAVGCLIACLFITDDVLSRYDKESNSGGSGL
jgi:MFS superfamily sulfate permease-like transporter